MDAGEIRDWKDYCEGRKDFDIYHFSNLFADVLHEPLSQQDVDALHTIFGYIPDASRAMQKMIRLSGSAPDRTDDEIAALVQADISEKRKVVAKVINDLSRLGDDFNSLLASAKELHLALGNPQIRFCDDADTFNEAREGAHQSTYEYCTASLFSGRKGVDNKVQAMQEAFYGIASDTALQESLSSNLRPVGIDINFDNYFELYLIGVEYAVLTSSILVINFRKLDDG